MGGVWTRAKLAFAAFFTILFKGRLPAALQVTRPAEPAAPAPPPAVVDGSDRAIQMLALMQRDGRLIDFLMEDLTAYADAQIGAAVRDVHAGCRGALTRYVTLEPILAGKEGERTSVPPDLDPASVRLVGNVTGRPPFPGTLLHHGWRVARIELPPLASSGGRSIVAQAEVEVA
ncbi:MAG TPA: DUF2760 domain-containing protein [Vicinamibacterales bacterium]|nr:DUF2760 domain-containing protein [Vicinamibacterales bacterium]